MIKKINLGDLILDYSEKGIESIGYIHDINIDKKTPKTVSHRIMYGVYWLSPDQNAGDYYTLEELNKWVSDGTWKYIPVIKSKSTK